MRGSPEAQGETGVADTDGGSVVDDAADGADGTGGGPGGDDAAPPLGVTELRVVVTLDGVPVAGADLWQGGTTTHRVTDADGAALFPVDRALDADIVVIASHPEARIFGLDLSYGFPDEGLIELTRFARDNLGSTSTSTPARSSSATPPTAPTATSPRTGTGWSRPTRRRPQPLAQDLRRHRAP